MRSSLLFVACFALVAVVSCVGSAAPSGDRLLATYTLTPTRVTSQSWSLDPSSNVASLTRSNSGDGVGLMRPLQTSSLRRDPSVYVPAKQTLLTAHSLQPIAGMEKRVEQHKKEKIVLEEGIFGTTTSTAAPAAAPAAATTPIKPMTDIYGYSFFLNTSTLIEPVPYSFACLIYDPIFDISWGLSSVQQADLSWNVTAVFYEYDGDFYSYYIPFWSAILPNPTSNTIEDPSRPHCAYDGGRQLFTFHWPAPATAPVEQRGGSLYNIKVSYANFMPMGQVTSIVNWPPCLSDDVTKQPSVLGLTYSSNTPNGLEYVALLDYSPGVFGAIGGVVDPVAGKDLSLQNVLVSVPSFVTPRVTVANSNGQTYVGIFETVTPFRVTWLNLATKEQTTSAITFPQDADTNNMIVLGVHDLN